MAASMKIYELTASIAGTDKTASTIRFKLADNQTVDTNNPITIPSTGVTRSFTKQVRMYCATPPDTSVDNLQVYTDGSNTFGAGISVNATNVGVTFAANASAALAGGKDFFGFTSVAPMNLDAVDTAAVTAIGFGGDILKLQMEVASTASSGTKSPETITFSYDEV